MNVKRTKADYYRNMVYENGKLSRVLTDVEYIITFTDKKPVYHYYLKDHLGNNRVVEQEDGKVEQVNHYYAFGGLMSESTGGEVQPYKYNGKELDHRSFICLKVNVIGSKDLSCLRRPLTERAQRYDYGARHYDPALARWMCMDPKTEKYYDVSPYAYCGNNPVNRIDPDGRKIKISQDQSQIVGFINQRAQGVFAVNNKNELYLIKKTSTESYSQYYAEKLTGLINDPNSTVTINLGKEVKELIEGKSVIKNVDKDHGGGVTLSQQYKDNKTGEISYEIDVTISGNANKNLIDQEGNSAEDEAADILYHEIVGHVAPKVLGSDTGNAIKNENKTRKELNKPLRREDPKHVE